MNERAFPHEGSAAEKLAFCVRYAILAPSTYNTQPWFFKISNDTIYLYADRRFGLASIDPNDRMLVMYCAGALYNLRLAIRYFGHAEVTEILPDPQEPDLLAKVKLGEKREASKSDKDLFVHITKRNISRSAFNDKEVSEEVLSQLKSAASEEQGWLHICNETDRRIVISMVAEGDQIQSSKKIFRRELASWLDPRRRLSGDGLPHYARPFDEIMQDLGPYAVRRFETNDGKAANNDALLSGTPVLGILGSKAGGKAEMMKAGQAFVRVMLKAHELGLSITHLNQPCEVPELRLRLHDEIEHPGRAQMILRIGYGGSSAKTPRRALESFIEFEGKAPEGYLSAKAPKKKGFFSKILGR